MKEQIYNHAKEFSKKALNHYVEKENKYSLINLSISAELLGKAFLAKIHPSLIIAKDFDSLLHVVGAGKHSRISPSNIRTIGAREVYRRCFQIIPKLRDYEEKLNLLADIRNGLVHLGEYETEIINKVFLPYLKFVKTILDEMNISFDDYFEEFCTLANTSILDSTKDIDIKVQCLIAKAKSNFQSKFKNIEKKVMDKIIKTIIGSYVLEKYNQELINCPACNNLSVVSGTHEVVDWEADIDKDGTVMGGYPIVVLFGDSLKCDICGLKLNSSEELETAGINPAITLDDIDPSDFYENIDYNDVF